MKTVKLLIAATLSACSFSALAQWQWLDDTGRKVFSDRPPPAHIGPKQIIKQPPGFQPPVVETAGRYVAVTGEQVEAQKEASQQAAMKKAQDNEKAGLAQQEAEKAAHEKAEQESQRRLEEAEQKKLAAEKAKAQKENCARARASQVTLQSGMRLAHINEKGEQGFLSDEQRKIDLQRAQQVIKENCV